MFCVLTNETWLVIKAHICHNVCVYKTKIIYASIPVQLLKYPNS